MEKTGKNINFNRKIKPTLLEIKKSIEIIIDSIKNFINNKKKEFSIISVSVIGKHVKNLPLFEYNLTEDVDVLIILKKMTPEFLDILKTFSNSIKKSISTKFPHIYLDYQLKGGPTKIYKGKPTILIHWLVFDISHYIKLSPLLHFSIGKSHKTIAGISPKKIQKLKNISVNDVLYAPLGIIFCKQMVEKGTVINSFWKNERGVLQLKMQENPIRSHEFYADLCCYAVLNSFRNLYEVCKDKKDSHYQKAIQDVNQKIKFFEKLKKEIRNGRKLTKGEIIKIKKNTLEVLEILKNFAEGLAHDKEKSRKEYYI